MDLFQLIYDKFYDLKIEIIDKFDHIVNYKLLNI
jgi:hypothetical protein